MRPLLLLSSLPLLVVLGCAAESDLAVDDTDTAEGELGTDPTIPRLPEPGGTGALAPWGGSDPAKWRSEAVVANAVSTAMNAAWSRSDVKDVVVAVPVKLWSSGFYEFGDGQANARAEFEFWRGQSRPPVVASLIKLKNAQTKIVIRFDRALPYGGTAFELRYNATTMPLTATRDASGDAVVEINLPSGLSFDDLLSQQSALVHPTGWADWFPLTFHMPVKKIADLRASQLRFSDGKTVIDRENVTSVGATDGKTTLQRLLGHQFAGSYNGRTGSTQPFTPASIHATYFFYGQKITTGVGQGWTWVADERPNGFKVMYTCFEKRRADLEATAPNGGVASGGGWHQINDAAETIMNDVEKAPVMIAHGRTAVWAERDLPSGRFSYGLGDVATFRWLKPGEAFITVKGTSAQPNYHWYFFQGSDDVCTEELINPQGQVPQNFDL
jgi:hypothetical protein